MKDNARKKNGIKVFVIVSVICFIVFLLTAAGSSTYTYKAVFDFSLYAEKDFSSEKKADQKPDAPTVPARTLSPAGGVHVDLAAFLGG